MTIAACYLSPEGVVLGADSATTFGSRNHFFHGQKIFEVGKEHEATLGLTMWGRGSMERLSYRTLIARFSDDVTRHPGRPVEESAAVWSDLFWNAYTVELKSEIDRMKDLAADPNLDAVQKEEMEDLRFGLMGGFCLGGYSLPDRQPTAFAITYSPDQANPDPLEEIKLGTPEFWGQPNMLQRLSLGIDPDTFLNILHAKNADGSPTWGGTTDELIAIIAGNKLNQPSRHLPIREAVDWVYSSIYTTIKAMKFANLPPVCGGPIEIAVITSDRYFRWVRHKDLDAALGRHPSKES